MAELKPSPLWVHCGAFGKKSTSNVSKVKLCISMYFNIFQNISVLDWSILIPCFLPGPISANKTYKASCGFLFQHVPSSNTDIPQTFFHTFSNSMWLLCILCPCAGLPSAPLTARTPRATLRWEHPDDSAMATAVIPLPVTQGEIGHIGRIWKGLTD